MCVQCLCIENIVTTRIILHYFVTSMINFYYMPLSLTSIALLLQFNINMYTCNVILSHSSHTSHLITETGDTIFFSFLFSFCKGMLS